MANIQIRGGQIKSGTVLPGNLDLTSTYDFSSGTLQAATPSASSDVATKGYVDSVIPDGFVGGDGIVITDGSPNDTISIDLATDPGLQFTSNKLDLKLADASLVKDSAGVKAKLKVESGGSLSVDANGLYIADGAIANGKLVNSTISGKSLGANLDSLQASATGALTLSSYNGSAAVSDLSVNVDGSSIAKNGSNQLEVPDAGITTAKLDDASVTAAKVAFATYVDALSGDGSTTAFDLSETIASEFAMIQVFKNGLFMIQVGSSPSGQDEFSLSLTGGAAGVSQITFGAAPTNGDDIRVWFIA